MFVSNLTRYNFMAHHTYFELFSVVRISKEEATNNFKEGEAVARVLALNNCKLVSDKASIEIKQGSPYIIHIEDILVIDKLENKMFTLDKIFEDSNYMNDYNNIITYLYDLTLIKENLI